jgi:hypothetical protein
MTSGLDYDYYRSYRMINTDAPTKSLAGPPEEFSFYRIPDPMDFSEIECEYVDLIELYKQNKNQSNNNLNYPKIFHNTNSDYIGSIQIPVDTFNFSWSVSSKFYDNLQFSLIDPNNKTIPIYSIQESNFVWGISNSVPSYTFKVNISSLGNHTLFVIASNLTSSEEKQIINNPRQVYIVWTNNDNILIRTFLNTYVINMDTNLSISANFMVDENPTNKRISKEMKDMNVEMGILEVTDPDGNEFDIIMNDDGENGDKNPGDGIWGVDLDVYMPGGYILSPTLFGNIELERNNSLRFSRRSRRFIRVSEKHINFLNKSFITRKNCDIYELWISVKTKTPNSQFRIYLELYAKLDNLKNVVPIGWFGGIERFIQYKKLGQYFEGFIIVDVHRGWLDSLWEKECNNNKYYCWNEYIIRNSYFSDIDTSYPLTQETNITVFIDYDNIDCGYNTTNKFNIKNIDIEMRQGYNAYEDERYTKISSKHRNKNKYINLYKNNLKRQSSEGSLVMLPGYCSDSNPWKQTSEIFTSELYFDEFNLNLSNNEYALRVLQFLINNDLDERLSFISHSQGGMVALHLITHYVTLQLPENTQKYRVIQSVGTPWQGTSLADDAANFARLFGIGCGGNSDLSRDGAANWLTGIPISQRKLTFFYTTTYKLGTFFQDECVLFMNLLLYAPNDGISEILFSNLPEGNYQGNTEEQCHTTNMRYSPHYLDTNRNTQMNRLASIRNTK